MQVKAGAEGAERGTAQRATDATALVGGSVPQARAAWWPDLRGAKQSEVRRYEAKWPGGCRGHRVRRAVRACWVRREWRRPCQGKASGGAEEDSPLGRCTANSRGEIARPACQWRDPHAPHAHSEGGATWSGAQARGMQCKGAVTGQRCNRGRPGLPATVHTSRAVPATGCRLNASTPKLVTLLPHSIALGLVANTGSPVAMVAPLARRQPQRQLRTASPASR